MTPKLMRLVEWSELPVLVASGWIVVEMVASLEAGCYYAAARTVPQTIATHTRWIV